MSIGERIRIARNRLGPKATQRWLADKAGTTPQAISQWESGGRPDLEKLPILRRALHVTFTWLLVGGEECPQPNSKDVRYEDALEEIATQAPRRGRQRASGRRT